MIDKSTFIIIAIVLFLISCGSIVGMDSDLKKGTLLHCALRDKRSLGTVKDLLEHGADPNNEYLIFNSKGKPLGYARFAYNKGELVQSHALHAALYYKNSSDYISLLCEYGVDVNQLNWRQETPSHVAIKCYRDKALLEILRTLVVSGANLSLPDGEGDTVFHSAVAFARTEVYCALVEWHQEHAAIKTLLLLKKRGFAGDHIFQKKCIIDLILNFASPGSCPFTQMYAYKHLYPTKVALEKKNTDGLTPYQMACLKHKITLSELRALPKKAKEAKRICNAQIHRIKEIKKLLDPSKY